MWRLVFVAASTPKENAGGQAPAHGPHVVPCFRTPSPSTQTFDPPCVLETTFFRGQQTRKTHGAKIHQRLVTVQICVAGLHQRLEGRGLDTYQMLVSRVPLVLHPTLRMHQGLGFHPVPPVLHGHFRWDLLCALGL